MSWQWWTRWLPSRNKKRTGQREKSLNAIEPSPPRCPFAIDIQTVNPPPHLNPRSPNRGSMLGRQPITAIFDPDATENKISREALEMLLRTRIYLEYQRELVCLEWNIVGDEQPFRSIHRIVGIEDVDTILFFHNRPPATFHRRSMLEVALINLAAGNATAASSVNLGSSGPIATEHGRVSTWPANKRQREGAASTTKKSRSRGTKKRPNIIPLADYHDYEERTWLFVDAADMTNPNYKTSGKRASLDYQEHQHETGEPQSSASTPEKDGDSATKTWSMNNTIEHQYPEQNNPVPDRNSDLCRTRPSQTDIGYGKADAGEIIPERITGVRTHDSRQTEEIETHGFGTRISYPESQTGPASFITSIPKYPVLKGSSNSVPPAPSESFYQSTQLDQSGNFVYEQGSLLNERPESNEERVNDFEIPYKINVNSQQSMSSDNQQSGLHSTRPTTISHIARPEISEVLAGNQYETLFSRAGNEVCGVATDATSQIHDYSHSESGDLTFPDDYWTWDDVIQNYFHEDIRTDGQRTKVWYPRYFD
ncbi:hypothetical protein HD806DRAFT_520662 [Xylariaceae sp. AK1471]|nr:hypothetical protein HD806DRAFT_520662 [Xylariaceae sp. AK1471]